MGSGKYACRRRKWTQGLSTTRPALGADPDGLTAGIGHVQRPVILCGIDEFIRRADLTDRAVFLSLPPIFPSSARRETEFWASFQQDRPRILGGLLDAVAGGLRELPSVQPAQLPRMADFAAFAEAVGRTLGWPAETALSDYDQNRRDATMSHLDDSPLATMLLDLSPDFFINWSGRPSELLDELTVLPGPHVDSPLWPKQRNCSAASCAASPLSSLSMEYSSISVATTTVASYPFHGIPSSREMATFPAPNRAKMATRQDPLKIIVTRKLNAAKELRKA